MGRDAPGGPATPEAALKQFLAREFPGLDSSQFAQTDKGEGFVAYTYSNRARGQIVVKFAENGDSWTISTRASCEPRPDDERG